MPRAVKKTCIPGLFCLENMTMFLLFVLLITVSYMYYGQVMKDQRQSNPTQLTQLTQLTQSAQSTQPSTIIPSIAQMEIPNPLESVYAPPLKSEGGGGVAINVPTRGPEMEYSQVGILTREQGDDMILPLMGRRTASGRDKYQYYTMANGVGSINTKLPLSSKGRSCTASIGCDELFNGDNVFVEGYKDTFHATIYENATLQYIPW